MFIYFIPTPKRAGSAADLIAAGAAYATDDRPVPTSHTPVFPDPAEKFDDDRAIQLAVDALAVNYRLGRLEAVGLLSLFGTEELHAVLQVVIDGDGIKRQAAATAAAETEAK